MLTAAEFSVQGLATNTLEHSELTGVPMMVELDPDVAVVVKGERWSRDSWSTLCTGVVLGDAEQLMVHQQNSDLFNSREIAVDEKLKAGLTAWRLKWVPGVAEVGALGKLQKKLTAIQQELARSLISANRRVEVVAEQQEPAAEEVQNSLEASEMPDLSELTQEEIKDYLEQMFKIGDRNGDGVLSAEEFASVLSKSGFRFEQTVIDKMVAAADVNGDGVIDFQEFVPAMMQLGETMHEELFGKKCSQEAAEMSECGAAVCVSLQKYICPPLFEVPEQPKAPVRWLPADVPDLPAVFEPIPVLTGLAGNLQAAYTRTGHQLTRLEQQALLTSNDDMLAASAFVEYGDEPCLWTEHWEQQLSRISGVPIKPDDNNGCRGRWSNH